MSRFYYSRLTCDVCVLRPFFRYTQSVLQLHVTTGVNMNCATFEVIPKGVTMRLGFPSRSDVEFRRRILRFTYFGGIITLLKEFRSDYFCHKTTDTSCFTQSWKRKKKLRDQPRELHLCWIISKIHGRCTGSFLESMLCIVFDVAGFLLFLPLFVVSASADRGMCVYWWRDIERCCTTAS